MSNPETIDYENLLRYFFENALSVSLFILPFGRIAHQVLQVHSTFVCKLGDGKNVSTFTYN